jgi:hypothetical protein
MKAFFLLKIYFLGAVEPRRRVSYPPWLEALDETDFHVVACLLPVYRA